MSLIVQKFGGTSVASVGHIEAVADKIARFREAGHDLVIVLSAMAGETNRLLALAREVMEQPPPREMDVLLSTGEQVTISLLCMALERRGCGARSFTGGQVRILTDESHTRARIREVDSTRIHAQLDQGQCRGRRRIPGRHRKRLHHHPRSRRLGHHGGRPGGGAGSRRMPDLQRCQRRLHHRSAHG